MRRVICREFADPVALEVVEEPDLGGRVAAVGPDTPSAPLVGTPVAALRMGFGCYTTHAVVPAGSLVPLPDGVDPVMAVGASRTTPRCCSPSHTASPSELVTRSSSWAPVADL